MMELIKDDIDLTGYMSEEAKEHRVMPASEWVNDVIDHFWKPDNSPRVRLPWKKTHNDFHLRPAEVSLWAGINGHGKSQLLGQVMHGLCEQNVRTGLASLEMRPHSTMARMTRQAYGADFPPKDYIQRFGQWTDGRLWIYDHVGSSNPKTMAAVIRYAVDKFQVQHFVIDNLMKVVHGEDDYNAQKDFVNSLCVIAKDTGCHIHLVLHIKKLRNETDIPNKFDIKGSGAITDLVDNVFIVWRNKAKETAMRMGEQYEPEDPDCLLILDKQRHGETEGRYRLFFDHGSMQYVEDRNGLPTHNKAEIGVTADEVDF
jgi:twinkle protein